MFFQTFMLHIIPYMGTETIPILPQHNFGQLMTNPSYVNINSTERQQKMAMFLTPPTHGLFAEVI